MSQLAKLDGFAERREALAKRYDRLFEGSIRTSAPFSRVRGCDPVLHLYALLIDYKRIGKSRARVMRELAAKGIGTQVHYLPVHHQPYYAATLRQVDIAGRDAYYARALSIPLFPAMTDAGRRSRGGPTVKSVTRRLTSRASQVGQMTQRFDRDMPAAASAPRIRPISSPRSRPTIRATSQTPKG